MTSKSATVFCTEFMMDDPLTVGPEPSSKLYSQCFGPKHHLFKGAGDADRQRADGEICILGTICFLGIGEFMENRIFNKEISRLHGISFEGQNHAFHILATTLSILKRPSTRIKKGNKNFPLRRAAHINKTRGTGRRAGFFLERKRGREAIFSGQREIQTKARTGYFF
ncbi:hypothetical protein PVL29_009101 [Vitis rotundifolia]|uniref:Uncharacterized protein n=1 Tax=Vitis rotundifolia TaxID=103349 RepID=A0AA39DU94_VITRO|nr:hypothetical protein PVL29_009101 [Vitis rotundifolia]